MIYGFVALSLQSIFLFAAKLNKFTKLNLIKMRDNENSFPIPNHLFSFKKSFEYIFIFMNKIKTL